MLSAEARTQYSIPGSRQQYRTSSRRSCLSAETIERRRLAQNAEGTPQHTYHTDAFYAAQATLAHSMLPIGTQINMAHVGSWVKGGVFGGPAAGYPLGAKPLPFHHSLRFTPQPI
jgi:hypothetical protein